MMNDLNRWRIATFSMGFLLLAVCVAWTMREGAVAQSRAREREEWEGRLRRLDARADELSDIAERADLATDEARRQLHHLKHPTTTPAESE